MAPRVIVLDEDPTDREVVRSRKWRHKPVVVDGVHLDSQAEGNRYAELLILQRAGEVTDLRVHPRYSMIVNGRYVGDYIADFEYRDGAGQRVVEDVKSPVSRTPVYRLKRKLVDAIFGINIVEIDA
jgi:hypothetical protein